MIEEYLLNYGVLGLWTISLLYKQYIFDKQLMGVIEKNTEVLSHVKEVITKCKGGKGK